MNNTFMSHCWNIVSSSAYHFNFFADQLQNCSTRSFKQLSFHQIKKFTIWKQFSIWFLKVLTIWRICTKSNDVNLQFENKFQKIETLCVMASSAGFLSLSWVLNVYSYMYFVNFFRASSITAIDWTKKAIGWTKKKEKRIGKTFNFYLSGY